MKDWYNNVITNWKELMSDRKFFMKFVFNFIVCYSIYMLGVRFLVWNRNRPGVVLDDPIQLLFTPFDFSFPTFLFTYVCIVSFLIYIAARPRDFYYGVRVFTSVFVARIGFIYLVPLATPSGAILLRDPFLDSAIWGNLPISNDLFFSGHVADICVFIFLCRSNSLRLFMTACAITVGVMVIWQHVHYTADVIAAPFFAYAFYSIFAKAYIQEESFAGFSPAQLGEKIRTIFVSRVR